MNENTLPNAESHFKFWRTWDNTLWIVVSLSFLHNLYVSYCLYYDFIIYEWWLDSLKEFILGEETLKVSFQDPKTRTADTKRKGLRWFVACEFMSSE